MSEPGRANDPNAIGDARSLFDTDEIRPIHVPAPPEPEAESKPEPKPERGSRPTPAPSLISDGYDLEGGPGLVDEEDLPAPVPIPIPPRPVDRPKTAARSRPKLEFERAAPEGTSEFEAEVAYVDPTWSRLAEWGPDLIKISAVGLGALVLSWLLGSFLVLILGLAVVVGLSYPILITLERPVRITPEHAVTDFFDAASHHFPHYRRMWLLLSSLGRESGRFDTFEQFRAHWKARIDRWKQVKGANKFIPLKFVVDGFRADKSTGKETSKADYTVMVYLRDRESEGPIETFRMVHGLVKGPDRMWYMNRGVVDNRSI